MLRVFSTFTGIGGMELGILAALGLRDRCDFARIIQVQRELSPAGTDSAGEVGESIEHIIRPIPVVFVGHCEIDKYASKIYASRFPDHHNYGDITKVDADAVPDHDLFVGGFPCQAFSVAGKRLGFADTRGTLFFDVARILKAKRPSLFLLENVKGLLSHDDGKTFSTIISTLDELGYDLQWQVLNSKDFGVPQNRERIFIVGHLRGKPRPKVFPFFPSTEEDTELPSEQVVGTLTTRYGTSNGSGAYVAERPVNAQVGTLRTHKDGQGFRGTASGLVPTIPARAREDGSGQPVLAVPVQIGQGPKSRAARGGSVIGDEGQEAYTVRSSQPNGVIIQKQGNNVKDERYVEKDIVGAIKSSNQSNPRSGGTSLVAQPYIQNPKLLNFKKDHENSVAITATSYKEPPVVSGIRRLTPLECERLQGFPDNWTAGVSDSQRYKCIGNAVTVNVIQAICERLLR